jgi:apolipoprotein D and lipocalin family protein
MPKPLAPFIAALAAASTIAMPALAAAPQPTQKIEIGKLIGRWYEVARIPNARQKGCEGGFSDWRKEPGGFSVLQACRKGGPSGPATEWHAKATVVDPATNAKIKMSFLGGIVNQEYWVLGQSGDGWLILATPGGNYLWLMATRPSLSASAKAAALSKIRQLGYDVNRLEFPRPAVN